ncbi:MAG: terminase large subunit [Halioglobus sp.]
MTLSERVIAFIQTLCIAEGPLAGEPFTLTPEQVQWLGGFLADDINVGAFSVGRGGGKSTLGAALAVAYLVGAADDQPKRVIEIYARVRDQAKIVYNLAAGLIQSLPEDIQDKITVTLPPRLEIRYVPEDGSGPHFLRVASADAKSALGGSPVLVVADERGFWEPKGDILEETVLTSLSKRNGRYAMLSTSAPSDNHEFSKWLDEPPEGCFSLEFRAPEGLPIDDPEGIKAANPGCESGVGSQLDDLLRDARRAIQRGGYAEQQFRLLCLNQRVPSDARAVILTVEQFKQCETDSLPPRDGPCVVGIDLGESMSMSCASYYWYTTGRHECLGWFPSSPDLAERGSMDRVGTRYLEMAQEGELFTMGGQVVPVAEWIQAVLAHVVDCNVVCVVADRFRQSLVEEGIHQAGQHYLPIIYRRNGWFDGGEDISRWRSAVLDGELQTKPSLLMRSAVSDAVCQRDDAGNTRLSKLKSVSRIDALSASVLAVGEGSRRAAHPKAKSARVIVV